MRARIHGNLIDRQEHITQQLPKVGEYVLCTVDITARGGRGREREGEGGRGRRGREREEGEEGEEGEGGGRGREKGEGGEGGIKGEKTQSVQTHNSLGTCISHLTFWQNMLWFTAHVASLSHSSGE